MAPRSLADSVHRLSLTCHSTWKPHDGDDDGGGDGYDLVQRCQQNVGDPHGANFYLCPPD